MVSLFRRKQQFNAGLSRSRAGWLGRITRLLERPAIDEATWEELEEALIGADVGVALAARLVERVKERAAPQGAQSGLALRGLLHGEMLRILESSGQPSPLQTVEAPASLPAHPYVVLVVGVNGVGKSTSIAKLAHLLAGQGLRVLLGAADTFRAAGIEQLQLLAAQAGAQVIAHGHGADPGAVVYDTLQAARARGADVVLIDTAGRLHTKVNLMEELKKIRRIVQRFDPGGPHETLLVIDATTGQNGLAQAKRFTEVAGVTGLFLAKLDGTAKGGIALAIAEQLRLPIRFVGTGEGLDDLAPLDAAAFVEALLTPEA